MDIDELDISILNLLREDARMNINEIARRLDRRRATIHTRIKKLEETGVIKGYTVIPNFEAIGYGITLYILVQMRHDTYSKEESPTRFSDLFARIPYVTEVHSVTGEWDHLLKIRVKDLTMINSDINRSLFNEIGVNRSLTLVAFESKYQELGNSELRVLNY